MRRILLFALVLFAGACADEGPMTTSEHALEVSPFDIPDPAYAATQSAPASASNGSTTLVVWSESTGVMAARISESSGTVLDPAGIAVHVGTTSRPSVASNGTNFLVVWSEGGAVNARGVSSTGTLLGTGPELVNGSGSNPVIASNGSNYLVAWEVGGDVHGTITDSAGRSLANGGFALGATASTESDPALAASSGGYFALWRQDLTALRTAVVSSGGLVSPANTLASNTTTTADLTGMADGWAVVWANSAGLNLSTLDALGTQTNEYLVASGGGLSNPAVARGAKGIAIAWDDAGQVYLQRRPAVSDSGATNVVSTAATASDPAVEALTDSAFAAWIEGGELRAKLSDWPSNTGGSPGSPGFESGSVSVQEGSGSVTLSVSRSGGSAGSVSVDYVTAPLSATPGDDYTSRSGTLSWTAGEAAAKTITIPITDDTIDEGDENFTVTLQNPQGGAALGTAMATVTIHDDDVATPGAIQFDSATYSVAEGGRQIVLAVVRSGGGSGAASVQYATAAGTAVSGADYTATSGTLSWSAGQQGTKTITVPVIDDASYEGTETFDVVLSGAAGASLGSLRTASVSIADNDAPRPGSFGFATTSASATEAQASVAVYVSRLAGSDGAVSVDFATRNGTATAGSDYVAKSGTLQWAAGDASSKTVEIALTDDNLLEGSETFDLVLTNPKGGATISGATATVAIADDEAPSRGSIGFATDAILVDETGKVDVTLRRAGGSDGTVSVEWSTTAGSAAEGSDYERGSGKVQWADGDAADKTVSVTILPDDDDEGDETFELSLRNPTGGATLGTTAVEITIVDDDQTPPGTIGFGGATFGEFEAEGVLTVTVVRKDGSGGAVSVDFSALGGTADASDFIGVTRTLRWGDGESGPREVDVPIVDDDIEEETETIDFVLSNVKGGANLGLAAATGTIIDDDDPSPGFVEVVDAELFVDETDGVARVALHRVEGSRGEATVRVRTVADTATDGEDYGGIDEVVTWRPGEDGEKFVEIELLDDDEAEGRETFEVSLSEASGALLAATTTVVEIHDDESDIREGAGVIAFTDLEVVAIEGDDEVLINVARFQGVDGPVSASWLTVGGTARRDSDFELATGSVGWKDGESGPKTIRVKLIDDEFEENTQRFKIVLSNPVGGAAIGENDTATVVIQDDDDGNGTARDEGGGGGCSSTGRESPVSPLLLGFAVVGLCGRRRRR